MNQMTASPQAVNNIKLPENYYSKSDYSNWYNYRLIDKSLSGEPTATERFVDSIYEELPINSPNHSKRRKKKALNSIISNLLNAYKCNLMLAISRDKNHYRIPRQYGMDHYTHTFIVTNGVDALEKADYIYQEKGYKDLVTELAENTRICVTKKLINEYYAFSNLSDEKFKLLKHKATGCNIIFFEPKLTKIWFATPILLKDVNKKLISYIPMKKIRRMRDDLNKYNSLLSNVQVIIPDTAPDTLDDHHSLLISSHFYDNSSNDNKLNDFTFYRVLSTYLYRVFNNRDFKQGGRFYGAGYQGVNGDDRKLILINENPTIECDYKAIHPRMCYHLLGIEYEDDPYNEVCMIDELRESVKILMNIMINVESSISAIMAFGKWLDEERIRRTILDNYGLDERSLMNRILDKHNSIRSFFNKGKGLGLQYLDSCIAEAVLMHFTKQGIPCLCIHDSFIVEKRYKDELGEVMKEKYKELIGFNCKIEFNK